MGTITVQPLLSALDHPASRMRIGIVDVLGNLRDLDAIPALLAVLSGDESNEVRWASAIALGEIGDEDARPGLIAALQDPDKYVRYGVTLALEKNGWIPSDPEGRVWFLAAAQRWDQIPDETGTIPVAPLIHHLRDHDPGIRQQAVKILGELHDPAAEGACDLALRDSSSLVRWEAVMAFPNCNIPLMHLPRGLSRRKREKNPYAAMLLNFFFVGLGYGYLGKWWGFLIFQVNVTAILIMGLRLGVYIPYLVSYAVSAVAVVHTWFYVRRFPDL